MNVILGYANDEDIAITDISKAIDECVKRYNGDMTKMSSRWLEILPIMTKVLQEFVLETHIVMDKTVCENDF